MEFTSTENLAGSSTSRQTLRTTGAVGDGSRRLDDPDDFVRREIELALRQGKPVIPVLLKGARMPGPQDLPPSMRDFSTCQAVALATDRWDADTAVLIDVLASHYGIHPGAAAARHARTWWRGRRGG